MGEDNKSNLCWILGVEYDEVFKFKAGSYRLVRYRENDVLQIRHMEIWFDVTDMLALPCMINHPDEIIRHKTFTQEEIDDAKVLHRLWIFKKIARFEYGLYATDYDGEEITINYTQFPTIEDGESYTYEQIIGGNN